MDSHVRIVAWIHLVFGICGLAAALIVTLAFGGIGAMVGAFGNEEASQEAAPAILTLLGVVFGTIIAITSLPAIAAGWGLLSHREWARILTIILSVFNLFFVPIGTIIGIYSIWVLVQEQSVELFRR